MNIKRPTARKILYVIASLRGGAAEHLLYLMEHFSQRGDSVLLVAPEDCPATADRMRSFGVRWLPLPLDRRWCPSAVRAIAETLQSEAVDLLHTHGLRAGYYGRRALARARKKGCRARSVYTIHGFHPVHYKSFSARWSAIHVEKRLFRRLTDHVIFVSDSDRTLFGNYVCPNVDQLYQRSSLILNGIRYPTPGQLPTRAEARARLELSVEAFAIGTLSRLNRQKAVHVLIEAAALLQTELPKLQVLIAGDGPLRSDLEALAGRRGVAERVRFLGYSADAPALYRALDCFVLSSLWEGLPLVLLEAAAAGIPIVASFVPGSDEVLEAERTGLFFARADAGDLAAQLRRVHDEPELARRLAAQARTTIPLRFSLEKMLEKTARVYDNVLSG